MAFVRGGRDTGCMRPRVVSKAMDRWLISILLVAFAFRALIPQGFMPSADRPFTLQICPDGWPAQMFSPVAPDAHAAHGAHHAGHHQGTDGAQSGEALSHQQHGQYKNHHCAFAASAGAALAPSFPPIVSLSAEQIRVRAPSVPLVVATQSHRPQQPRAPPHTLS
jgi:hypothetical protein